MVMLWIQPKTCSSCILDWMLHQYLLLDYKKTNLKHVAVAFLIEWFINICYWTTKKTACLVCVHLSHATLSKTQRISVFAVSLRTASPYGLIWHAKCRWYWEPSLYMILTRKLGLPLHVQYMYLGLIEHSSYRSVRSWPSPWPTFCHRMFCFNEYKYTNVS